MYPSFEKLLHGDYCHLHTPPNMVFIVSSAGIIFRQDSP
ncbi:hypothetical protein EDO6_00944 [Paenibacillus xylanexedens]|nr:hypothetical protein EDO6_00944 [Paenibacillus xylanexedens]